MSKKSEGGKKKAAEKEETDDHRLPLADVIASLRNGLKQARADGLEEDIRLLVKEAEVELQFGVTKGVDGKVGVNFWVYSAEGGGKMEQEAVQTIRLTLKPEAIDPHSPTEEPNGQHRYQDVYVNDEGRDRPPVETESPTEPE
ncbi:MAG: hypothetical protein HQ518_31320 [Rhodopirellula sp.]|nr:hypothetical protein [Rhodopirellula sp.]